MSRCYCPPLFRRTIHRIHTILRRYPVFPGRPICSCPGPTFPLIPPSICAPLSSPLTRRSRDNSLVKRPDDASLFYRGLFPRLEIAFRAPGFALCLVRQRKPLSFGNEVCQRILKRALPYPRIFLCRTEKDFCHKDLRSACAQKRNIID